MSRYFNIFIFHALLLWFIAGACTGKKKQVMTLPTFDLGNPVKFILPYGLLEISGISFHNGNNDTVYIIQDEAGKLFRMTWGVKQVHQVKFAKNGDYEDVTIIKNKVIVLKSNGTLFSFAKSDTVQEEVEDVTTWKNLLPEGEYEGLYGDEGTGKLYVLCKRCVADAHTGKVSGFILDIDDLNRPASRFSINVDEIRQFSKKVKSGFRPSGLAKDPLTGEWFIISAVNKILVIADSTWKVKGAYPFNGNTFYQPEGIAFDAAGNLYISNEGDELSNGNVLKFVRRK